jgi:uncharacterized phage protein gp47/JayE
MAALTPAGSGPDTFEPRLYPDIVRDLLTTLTGGTVRESLTVPAGDGALPLDLLAQRPVRRVSHLEGVVEVGTGPNTRDLPYVFTSADFELIASTGVPGDLDRIAFRRKSRRPIPGSTLVVNYYPVQTRPVPLTDLNVGSVTRTVLETMAVELALTYQQLRRVYRSAFLSTAEGDSLDQVVALIGVSRLPANQPIVTLRFTRRPDVPGRLAIPAGTAVTDLTGTRYLTTVELVLEPGEAGREVLAAGESPATKIVDAGALDRMEVAVAGVSTVTNPQPSRAPASPETDDDLRRRAAGAFHGVVRGTTDALTFAVRSVAGVGAVKLTEAPNGVPGEVLLDVAYADPSADVKAAVALAVEEFRPAGVQVLINEAARLQVAVRVALTLAAPLTGATDLLRLQSGVEQRLAEHLTSIAPGGTARRTRLASIVLTDPEIADAEITLTPAAGSPGPELTLPAGQVIDLTRPFEFPAPVVEGAANTPTTSTVNAILPVHLVAGVTLSDVSTAVTLAVTSYLGGRNLTSALTVDGLAAAIRDDTRFGLVRAETTVTVEGGGRFVQLTDGIGAYTPVSGETLMLGQIDVDPREGGA